MSRRTVFAVVLFAVLESPLGATTWTVTLSGTSFSPATLTIRVGDTVSWDNVSGFHNVTADDGAFGSGAPAAAPWQYAHAFPVAGVYGYHCAVHGGVGTGMFGIITVAPGPDEIAEVISAWSFHENAPTVALAGDYRGLQDGSAYFNSGVSLPGGSAPTRLEVEACGQSAGAGSIPRLQATLSVCPLNSSTCDSAAFVDHSFDTTLVCATFEAAISGVTVDNLNHTYPLALSLEGLPNQGDVVGFRSVRVYYRRQISAPPPDQTFADVQPGTPYYQFVEALAAAGITSGCGDGTNFCPDNPVTRAQLAMFLARAMGLFFPN